MCSPADRSSPEPGCSTSDCTSPGSSTDGCASPTLTGESCCGHGSGCRCTTTSAPSEVKLLPTPTTGSSEDPITKQRRRDRIRREQGARYVFGKTLEESLLLLPSTSSPGGSPAKAPAAPATAPDSSTPRPLCGSRCGASFVRFDPAMSSSKMWGTSSGWRLLQASLLDPFGEPFSGTWPRSGSMCGGIVFPLRPSAPRTSVTGCSPLLPSPLARTNSGTEVSGESVTALLPTPTARAVKDTGAPSEFERKSPELTAFTIEKGGGGRWSPTSAPLEQTIKDDLSASTGASTDPPSEGGKPSTGLRLNPAFVEWMQGCPTCSVCGRGWTDPDCPHSATEFTSTSPTSSGSPSFDTPRPDHGRAENAAE